MTITVDGVDYHVRLPYSSLQRSFSLIEGQSAGTMQDLSTTRDVIATRYSYSLQIQPDPAYRSEYDSLFEVLSAPVDSHEVTMPYGQTTITFVAGVQSGSDTFGGVIGGENAWSGMSITFTPIAPQRYRE